MNTYTYEDIAGSFELWAEFVDPSATMTEAQFDDMSITDRIALIVSMFGDEVAA
jgi:hypothetical protein